MPTGTDRLRSLGDWRARSACCCRVLPACTPLEPPPAVQRLPQTRRWRRWRFALGPFRHRPRRDDAAAEAEHCGASWRRLPAGRRLTARVVGHADSGAADVHNDRPRRATRRGGRRHAAAAGVREVESRPPPAARPGRRPRSGRSRLVPRSPASRYWSTAPRWSCPAAPTGRATPATIPATCRSSNLGCANAYNLGLMVADPARSGDPPAARTGRRHARGRGRSSATAPTRSGQLEAEIIQ